MASIQRRTAKDGAETFRIGAYEDGRLRWSPTITSPAGAAELKALVERIGFDAAMGVLNVRAGRTDLTMPLLSEWLERHLENLGASATPGTVADYRRMAARTWGPRLGSLPLDAISREAVTKWVAWQRKQPTKRKGPDGNPATYSPKSISNAQRFLSSVLQGAVDAELITRNPAKGVPLPSDAERVDMVFLSHAEFAAVYDQVPGHYQPFVAFLAGTGCRWGEATALRPGDFDLDPTTPTVRITRAWKKGETQPVLGSTKSKRGRRTITLPAELLADLRPLVEATKRDGFVFTAVEGGRIRSQLFHPRVWHKAVEDSGIDQAPRVHDLRHTHVSWLLAAGVGLPVISRRLGHESIKTTVDTYGHLSPDAHAGAAAAAGAALGAALPALEA